LSFWGTKNLRK